MCRLSYIVPFYGVEKYIEECIRSLYDQDIPQEEYEVICVDDCSKDGSKAIVERLQKEYPTLRILEHTENKRQGGARNTGMREAKGKYVWFVDSDDVVFPNMLKELLSIAEKNRLDMLQFDYVREMQQPQKQDVHMDDVLKGEDYLFRDGEQEWVKKVIGPWMQLFRRDFLEKKHLQFVEGVQFEDTDYMLRAMLEAERVQHCSIVAYGYRVNDVSTTKNATNPIKTAWQINQLGRIAGLLNSVQREDGREMIERMLGLSLSMLRRDVKRFDYGDRKCYRSALDKRLEHCKPYMNWRTWVAIRYGIPYFVK